MSTASLQQHVAEMKREKERLTLEQLQPTEYESLTPSPSDEMELRQRKASSAIIAKSHLPLPEYKPSGMQLTQAELESLLPQVLFDLLD